MARIDPERGHLVVQLVYDGPAQAGKTTSVRALARSLGTQVVSGEEAEGRTLYFDWLDYVGGLFEGMPIRCQIVSAPGQAVLEGRRRRLLESADAVVFVADSQPERMAENLRSYTILREIASREQIAVGIVMQANKRDVPDAMPLDALRDALGGPVSLAITESIAERGEGVRETFVLAIRFALDRVRALWAEGRLDRLPPNYENAQQLLAAMKEHERQSEESLVVMDPEPTPAIAADAGPRPPDASIPAGLVWPPVQGRIIVHEAARHTIRVARRDDGSWHGVLAGGWQISSPAEAVYSDLESGREALIAWARWHAATITRLSPERAIVLAPAAPGEWRLWQIVHTSRTLLDLCREAVRTHGRAAGEKVFEIIDLRAQAFESLVRPGLVDRISLELVAVSPNGAPVYAGPATFPPRGDDRDAAHDEPSIVESELLPALRNELAHVPDHLPELLASIEAEAARQGRGGTAYVLRRGLLNT